MFVRVFYVLYPPWLMVLCQNLAAETAAYLTTKHPDYAVLAARIAISNLHKETKKNFSQVIKDLYNYGMYSVTRVDMALSCIGSQPEERKAVRHDIEGNI
jgi:hypothetical protein